MAAGQQDQRAKQKTLGRTSPGGKKSTESIVWFFILCFSSVVESLV